MTTQDTQYCQWALLIANKRMTCDALECPLDKCPEELVDEASRLITCGLAEVIIEYKKKKRKVRHESKNISKD